MKRFLALVLSILLILPILSVAASAASADKLISTTTEYYEDGSYAVINVYENMIQPRTGKTGYKDGIYYSFNGTSIFKVTVNGSFDYVYGISSTAKSATANVSIYNSDTSFVSKNAYTSGASAVATGTVKYLGNVVSKTVTLTCDKYGNLS